MDENDKVTVESQVEYLKACNSMLLDALYGLFRDGDRDQAIGVLHYYGLVDNDGRVHGR